MITIPIAGIAVIAGATTTVAGTAGITGEAATVAGTAGIAGDRRWDNRRYHHSPSHRNWVPPGHRHWNGYRRGYRDGRYYGGHYNRGRDYYDYPRYYRRSSLDGTLILSFPIY